MIEQARQAWQRGERPTAVALLKQALRDNPRNPEAWLLAAEFAPNPAAKEECLNRAAQLTPARQAATHPAIPTPAPRPVPPPPAAKKTAVQRPWWWAGLGGLALLIMLGMGWLAWQWSPRPAPAIAALPSPSPTTLATAVADEDPPATAVPSPTATVPPSTATPTPNPIQPKQIASLSMGGGSGNVEGETAAEAPRATWTATPSPTPTPTPTPTPQPTFVAEAGNFVWPIVGENERWIRVNLTNQHLYAYEGANLVFNTPISSGLPQWATVTGQFRIYYRLPKQTMDGRRLGFDYVTENVPYVQYFYKDFALHGAYWHNNFGQQMSHGCVNLSVADSEWLYNWATYGTLVYVHY